jgi:hypothetical protein
MCSRSVRPETERKNAGAGEKLQAGGEFAQVYKTVKKNGSRRYRLAMNARDERSASHWK